MKDVEEKKMKTDEAIKLYDVLISRNKHEGLLFWTRFSAFFVFVSLFSVAWLNSLKSPNWDEMVKVIIIFAGSLTSFAWFFANLDGAAWVEYFNSKIVEHEKEYSALPPLYTDCREEVKIKLDVVMTAIILSAFVFAIWILIAFLYNKILVVPIVVVCMVFFLLVKYFSKRLGNIQEVKDQKKSQEKVASD